MIKPVMLCGCETSTMTQQKKSSFTTWERKILRKMCEKKKVAGKFSLMMNCGLCVENQIFNDDTIKKARMGWSSSKNV